ncbi:MAG TPA: hypothetical protein VNK48_09980 [Xanthobacteraceae bacterium]|nr:hypothetical protein [Xanthobacteraceae bacterium]
MNRIIWGALLGAVASCAGTPLVAAERAPRPSLLPPHEIITVVRSTGLVPLGRPARRGNDYVLRARDEIGQQVRVVVDGRVGEVRSVAPIALGRRDRDEPPYPSIFESGPPIYDRRPAIGSPPVIGEEDDEPPVYRRAAPPPAAPPVVMPPQPAEREALTPGAPPESVSPQILTVPRPPAAVPTSPSTAALPESESEENVLLPPPPPRFPQRVPPNVKPQQKPAQSATKPNAAKKPDAKKSDASPSRETVPANSNPPAAGSNAPPLQLQN